MEGARKVPSIRSSTASSALGSLNATAL